MVVLPYFDPMGKLKFEFSLSLSIVLQQYKYYALCIMRVRTRILAELYL